MRRHLPERDYFVGAVLPQFPNYSMVEQVGTGTNGQVYRGHASEIQSDLAFKFVPTENLPHDPERRSLHLAEARNANSLDSDCVVRCLEVLAIHDGPLDREFVVFVSQFVSGSSLAEFIKNNPNEVSVTFIEEFLSTLLGLLFELDARGMIHGDLHAGNVLVSRSRFDLTGQATFKITDFGIVEVTGIPHGNDYLYTANILRDLLKCISYSDQQPRDRFVFDVLRSDFLSRHLIETDTLADPLARRPRELYAKLTGLDNAYREATSTHSAALMVTPFDYPNCEQIGNSNLLLRNLYSNLLLGLPEIHSRSNLVLTGPRGCGKTTVFRALSLDYRISVDSDEPETTPFIGVYYRCDDLYFAFPRYQTPSRSDALDVAMHFIVVSLMTETLRNVENWAQKRFSTEFQAQEASVTNDLWSQIGLQPQSHPAVSRFSDLITRLTKQRARAAKMQRLCHLPNQSITGYLGPSALLEFCSTLRTKFSFLRDRPFFYFIDDFSTPKITEDLQRNLNRMLMTRHPDVFFKISTESPISFERRDIDGKQYVEEREFELLNLGLRYLQHDGNQVQSFLEDLFGRRFREVESFPCDSLAELLGHNERNENEMARLSRANKAQSTLFGVETITALCSGDIHYMIRLVRKMVEDANGQLQVDKPNGAPAISPSRQSASIRAAAGEFMESVRNLPRRGNALAMVVTAVGNVARSYLQYVNAVNVTGSPPHQASRIEPYGQLCLSDDAQLLLDDLIRFSILLIDPRGKSRRGEVVPRFYLRRYLIPHFHLTFSKRDSLELDNWEIEMLLTNPHGFQETKRIRSSDDARARRWANPDQRELFGDENCGR